MYKRQPKCRGLRRYTLFLRFPCGDCGAFRRTGGSIFTALNAVSYTHLTLPRQAGDGIAQIVGVASPLRLQGTPPVLRHAPPALGQHTDEVLSEMGLDESRLAALRDSGVI